MENIIGEQIISFEDDSMGGLFVTLAGNPKEYIEQVKQAKHLSSIRVPEVASKQFYDELRELIKNCKDNVKIVNDIGEASIDEFLLGEEIIKNLLDEINPEWGIKQKAAFVHYKMGKIFAYKPDFYTERKGNYVLEKDVRSIWKSLAQGISVCNGITSANMNILSRLGIRSKALRGKAHTYLLIETEEGNIITDPTWDLSRTLYDAKPACFGRSYEDFRRIDGINESHLVENPPEDVIEIQETELREIFHSIGITNEDRGFRIPLFNQLAKMDYFFQEYVHNFGNEATHVLESIMMLESTMMQLGIGQINIECVYSKEDEQNKNPMIVVHSGEKELTDNFVIINAGQDNPLQRLSANELDKRYRVHSKEGRKVPFWKTYIKKEQSIEKESVEKI